MKPLKETRVGKWLSNNAPQILETVGDFVPAPIKGTMNVVKNLVKMIPGISPDKVAEFDGIADEHEVEILELHNQEMANARAENFKIQSHDRVLTIVKIRPTVIAYFITLIWGALTIYIAGTILSIIKRDPGVSFEAVLALYSAVNLLFGSIVQFDFGGSAGSAKKQELIEKMITVDK